MTISAPVLSSDILQLAQHLLSLGCLHPSVSEPDEEFPDFRLEDDDDREDSDVEHRFHDRRHQPHVEGRYEDTYYIQGYDGDEYAHCRCSLYPPEGYIYDHGQQEYVEYVREGQLQEAEDVE